MVCCSGAGQSKCLTDLSSLCFNMLLLTFVYSIRNAYCFLHRAWREISDSHFNELNQHHFKLTQLYEAVSAVIIKDPLSLCDPGEVSDTLSTHQKHDFTLVPQGAHQWGTTHFQSVFQTQLYFIYFRNMNGKQNLVARFYKLFTFTLEQSCSKEKIKISSLLDYYFYFSCLIGPHDKYHSGASLYTDESETQK